MQETAACVLPSGRARAASSPGFASLYRGVKRRAMDFRRSRPGLEAWPEVYRKIRDAGKLIQTYGDADTLAMIMEQLDGYTGVVHFGYFGSGSEAMEVPDEIRSLASFRPTGNQGSHRCRRGLSWFGKKTFRKVLTNTNCRVMIHLCCCLTR